MRRSISSGVKFFLFTTPVPPLATSSCNYSILASNSITFFWRRTTDTHFFSRMLERVELVLASGSNFTEDSSRKSVRVFENLLTLRYSAMALWSSSLYLSVRTIIKYRKGYLDGGCGRSWGRYICVYSIFFLIILHAERDNNFLFFFLNVKRKEDTGDKIK